MNHVTPLISTIVIGIGLAFIFGTLAARMRISPLIGYLVAGIVVGPHSPGFVADQAFASQLAEIGVILLMFGVGLHFSWKDLMSVGGIAVPGAIAQIAVATLLGWGLATLLGWSMAAGMVFGLALSVASTVVLLRALQERRLLDTERGRIAVGWLVVEDIAMVLALVLVPAIAGVSPENGGDLLAMRLSAQFNLGLAGVIGFTLAKVAAFVVLMVVVGRRAIPWLLHFMAHLGNRELFRLAVLAVALGVAYGATVLFGVSLALGAFFAGMVMSESELSHQAAQETLPLRDAFAVLFFVSVGMLFDPTELVRNPGPVAAVLFIVLIGKSLAAFLIVRLFRHPPGTALTIAASLAQIGEFSFILAEIGVRQGILPDEARNLILAGAILSILINPLAFVIADRMRDRLVEKAQPAAAEPDSVAVEPEPFPRTQLSGHVVVIGSGVVGAQVAAVLRGRGMPYLVVEESMTRAERMRDEGAEVLVGNAADPKVLEAANLAEARQLVVAIPQAFEAGQVVQQARAANPSLEIVARAYSDAETEHLAEMGADLIVTGTREVARAIVKRLAHQDDPPPPHADPGFYGAFI
jgi:monovalent cation:H+ antiporter-2, CPA2 family